MPIIGLILGAGLISLGLRNYYYAVRGVKDENGRQKVLHINPAVEGNIFGIHPINFWGALIAGGLSYLFFTKVMKK